MPPTRSINIREFRQDMKKYLKEVEQKHTHFILMRHAEAVAELMPVNDAQPLKAPAAKTVVMKKKVQKPAKRAAQKKSAPKKSGWMFWR